MGAGDGSLTELVLAKMRGQEISSPERVTFVDPWVDPKQSTKVALAGDGGIHVSTVKGPAESIDPSSFSACSVFQFVHSAYYILLAYLEVLRGTGKPMVVVVDTPQSVFAKAWKWTNPELYARFLALHDWLSRYTVYMGIAAARLVLPHSSMARRKVLSFLCQAGLEDLDPRLLRVALPAEEVVLVQSAIYIANW